ncbi:MAG: N-alpha-acetyl-L-2,4-diaminobutyric acid deacetylase [Gammaproteobacteria bacterium]|nr:N-alpha-acetyl-L-2,4-diaminobutyric acid deacetylase [Gammaproteobacteria bacterium]
MRDNPITATVEFNKKGVHHGHLKLPYSHDASAWGAVMIPITIIKNGTGPTAILTGANHGDEYEGPVALLDLASGIDVNDVRGRVIVVPMMNYPAFQAAKRTSPIDNGNLNRLFPGRPDGTVTEKIADYFQRTLLPMSDYVLDIHSGGKTLNFVPLAAAHVLEDKSQQDACVAAMRAFNAPYSAMLLELDSMGMYDTAAEEMGKVFVSTELGGGGATTRRSVGITRRGVRNFLIHAGILQGEATSEPTVNIDMPDHRCYVTCYSVGLVEFCVDLGESVAEGDTVARVHDTSRTGQAPHEYQANIDGILVGRHFPGTTRMGDSLAVIGVPRE